MRERDHARSKAARLLAAVGLCAALLLGAMAAHAALLEQAGQGAGGLAIAVEGTREHVAVGSSFAVSGTLTNTTKSTVYLDENDLRLKMPTEVEPSAAPDSFWYGVMPAADHGESPEKYHSGTLALPPGQATAVWWTWRHDDLLAKPPSPSPSLLHQFAVEREYLFFAPGRYRFTITALYRLTADPSATPQSAVATASLDLTAPWSAVLVGAALGGLIAYLVLPQARRAIGAKRAWTHWALRALDIAGAVLLSVVVTILLARLADVPFPIRVTVSDLWGAVAVGFVANYLGVELLSRMIRKPSESDKAAHAAKKG